MAQASDKYIMNNKEVKKVIFVTKISKSSKEALESLGFTIIFKGNSSGKYAN